jgi:formylglycine-generating enzyme required for sulfatase activity
MARSGWLACCIVLWAGLETANSADPSRTFRISAVQENQVWIEGGLLDGLEQGMEGEIYFEISVSGQKKRIVAAKVHLSRVEDHESTGILKEQSGTINVGYRASFAKKAASDLLLQYNKRASESYAAKDYSLAEQYYRRILELVPGDAFAAQKIRDCETQIRKIQALAIERRNVPYYREVIRTSLNANNPESRELARVYAEKILLVEPGDPESLKVREKLTQIASEAASSVPPQATPDAPVSAASKTSALLSPAIPAAESKKETKPAAIETAKSAEAPKILKRMVLISEGDFSVGSPPGRSPFENETPKHQVHLAAFYMDKYEVTNEQYKEFCDATGRSYPGYFSEKNFPPGSAKKPVVMVSWIDADAYARWAGKRLPAEVEWEAAASGVSGRIWPWGNSWISHEANTRENGEDESADVGSHPLDVSEFGIFDMAGNVSEWTQDWYQPYPGNTHKEKEYGEQFKVLRGGSSKASKEFARAQFRARLPDGFRSTDLGFRCVISAKDVKK